MKLISRCPVLCPTQHKALLPCPPGARQHTPRKVAQDRPLSLRNVHSFGGKGGQIYDQVIFEVHFTSQGRCRLSVTPPTNHSVTRVLLRSFSFSIASRFIESWSAQSTLPVVKYRIEELHPNNQVDLECTSPSTAGSLLTGKDNVDGKDQKLS